MTYSQKIVGGLVLLVLSCAGQTPVLIRQSGNDVTVTMNNALKTDGSAVTQPISAAALPLPALAATSTKQSDGSQKTQIVDGSGNVIGATSNALDINIKSGNPSSISATQGTSPWVVSNGGTFATQAAQSGTWNISNISGTVSLPTGASTAAKQPALGTAGSASADVITVQGIASMTALKVDGSAVTQPISGTVTAAQATAGNLNATVVGTGTFAVQAASTLSAETTKVIGTVRTLGNVGAVMDGVNTAATAPANGLMQLGIYNSTEPSPTTGQSVGIQLDSKGRQRQVIMDAAGNTRGANVDANNNLGVVLAAETTKVIGTINPGNTANTTAWLVNDQPATSGGLSTYVLEPAASDNHANIKNGAGQVYFIHAFNNSATINYLRLYNAASGFNGCNSATNLVWEGHIPASTSDAGFVVNIDKGIAFSTGISICVTGAYGQTSTTNATASAISLTVGYK